MTFQANQPARYWAYSNYIVATARLITKTYPALSDLAAHVTSSRGFKKLKRSPVADAARVGELIRSSWFTEIYIAEALHYPSLLPYSNPWAMVQVYYMVYLMIRAYFAAASRPVAPTHQSTLRTIASDLVSCKDRFPTPWRCACIADPTTSHIILSNDSNAPPITLTNAQVSPYTGDPWQHFGLFLKTTRRRELQASLAAWRSRNPGRRATSPIKAGILAGMRPTSFFDALYRIRARSNYMDVDAFAFGNISTADAMSLHTALLELGQYTLCLFELLLARLAGKAWLDGEVSSFLGASSVAPVSAPIRARWAAIRSYL